LTSSDLSKSNHFSCHAHLAIAIAYRAIQNSFDAFFTTAAPPIDDLSAAFRAGELADALPTYTHSASSWSMK